MFHRTLIPFLALLLFIRPFSAAAATPAPASDPLAWLMSHKDRWPRDVMLIIPQTFPLVLNGRIVENATLPTGTKVGVARIPQSR